MKVVSRYVREQKRYTKNDLKSKFSFDEDGVEKFIKNLKAYGVLKSVKNTDDQLEMSDLVDDDVEITDETAESGDCLYVFTYVGVITCGSRVIKVYPKYLLSKKDDNVLDEMKQVVKVLERYSRSEEQIINVFNGDGENRSFNILAVILFLINDYYEYGIYTNSEDIIEVNGEGEILWGKTIDESFAMIEDNRPYYMELYTEKSVEDDMDYFKRLHECVLTECSRQLRDAQLDALFDMGIRKDIEIDGQMVAFKASAAIPRIYRLKFQRDIYKDLALLEKSIGDGKEESSNLDMFSLEMFENIAFIMAKHADPSIPDTPEEWLDNFNTFSIYQVLPQLIELWGLNIKTDVEAKKNFVQQSVK